jgi:hypothetical protein
LIDRRHYFCKSAGSYVYGTGSVFVFDPAPVPCPPAGGEQDYARLFHGGHRAHAAHVDATLDLAQPLEGYTKSAQP